MISYFLTSEIIYFHIAENMYVNIIHKCLLLRDIHDKIMNVFYDIAIFNFIIKEILLDNDCYTPKNSFLIISNQQNCLLK